MYSLGAGWGPVDGGLASQHDTHMKLTGIVAHLQAPARRRWRARQHRPCPASLSRSRVPDHPARQAPAAGSAGNRAAASWLKCCTSIPSPMLPGMRAGTTLPRCLPRATRRCEHACTRAQHGAGGRQVCGCKSRAMGRAQQGRRTCKWVSCPACDSRD